MPKVNEITSAWWSMKLGQIDSIVEDQDDISQSIAIILRTPKRSRPHKPEFGSDLNNFIDQPISAVTPAIVQEVIDAVLKWEPRVKCDRVEVYPAASSIASLGIRVYWTLVDEIVSFQGLTEVTL